MDDDVLDDDVYSFADTVYETNLIGHTAHACNPRCSGSTHFDVAYEFLHHVTEEQVMAVFSFINVLTCKRLLEYPIVLSVENRASIGAYGITFTWKD